MNWTLWALAFCAFLFDSMIEACTPCTCRRSVECSGQYADCRQESLTEVPSTLPIDTCFLNLYSNEFTTIENTTFSGLSNLEDLFLDGNRITTIEDNAFSGVTKLKTL
ncbi:biglycan-like [Saccostrea cucullata]|uniref:biglycan-like n=1 Tax=Saccostrea cuccullata TaxID=36930 RepID=UPI002ED374D4